jgi:hypothetical protein
MFDLNGFPNFTLTFVNESIVGSGNIETGIDLILY